MDLIIRPNKILYKINISDPSNMANLIWKYQKYMVQPMWPIKIKMNIKVFGPTNISKLK